ncbi:MAG TPA: protein phosphatase 2C domain-containing protein, partial [Anaerolineae bacterium]
MDKSVMKVIGASVQGTSHLSGNVPCQDAHGFRQLPGGEWLIAVADGAGSAARSAEGAAIAVEHALSALAITLQATHPAEDIAWRVVMSVSFGVARDAIVRYAELAGDGVSLRDFATTLTLAVVTLGTVCVGQLGDGFA